MPDLQAALTAARRLQSSRPARGAINTSGLQQGVRRALQLNPVWEIQSNDGSGVYTIREQVYDWAAKTWADLNTLDFTAHDLTLFAEGEVGWLVQPYFTVDAAGELRYMLDLAAKSASEGTGPGWHIADKSYIVSGDNEKVVDDLIDWRGRKVWASSAYYEGIAANADLNTWNLFAPSRLWETARQGIDQTGELSVLALWNNVGGTGSGEVFIDGDAGGRLTARTSGYTAGWCLHVTAVTFGTPWDQDNAELIEPPC